MEWPMLFWSSLFVLNLYNSLPVLLSFCNRLILDCPVRFKVVMTASTIKFEHVLENTYMLLHKTNPEYKIILYSSNITYFTK